MKKVTKKMIGDHGVKRSADKLWISNGYWLLNTKHFKCNQMPIEELSDSTVWSLCVNADSACDRLKSTPMYYLADNDFGNLRVYLIEETHPEIIGYVGVHIDYCKLLDNCAAYVRSHYNKTEIYLRCGTELIGVVTATGISAEKEMVELCTLIANLKKNAPLIVDPKKAPLNFFTSHPLV